MITNLKAIRKANFVSLIKAEGGASALSRKIDTSPSYISQIMSEKLDIPIGERLARRIEEAMKLPEGWIDTDHEGVSAAGAPVATEDDIRALATGLDAMPGDRPRMPRPRSLSKRAFSYQMKTEDMQPTIPAGSFLVVEPVMDARPGHIVLVSTPVGIFIREITQNPDGSILLKAANPTFPPVAKTDDTKIVGVVIDSHRSFID